MVFGSYKASPLFNRFNLPYSYKRNAFDSFDEHDCGATDVTALDDSNNRCAYDFDNIQIKSKNGVTEPQNLLPMLIPCIEPLPSNELDETDGLDPQSESFECSPKPLYQWNRPCADSMKRSQEYCANAVDITKSFISFERNLFDLHATIDSNDECEEDSDETYLLHNQSLAKSSKMLNSFASHHPNGFCSKAYRKLSRTLADESFEDDTLYLMQEAQEFKNSYFERQLAFDLDSVDEPNLAGDSTSHRNTSEPQWVLEPDDIALETPPPTPGLQSGSIFNTDSRLYCDEDFMETDDEAVLFSSLLYRHRHSKFPFVTDASDQSTRRTYNPLEAEDCLGSCANLIPIGHTRKIFDYGRLRRRNRGRKTKRNGSHKSRNGRKPSGRHSPVQERTFSPNLSTVTEKPSEEDASCLPTPRSCKESQPFAESKIFKVASRHSEDETTETCMTSKDSDN